MPAMLPPPTDGMCHGPLPALLHNSHDTRGRGRDRPIERDTWDLFEHPFGPDGVRALVRLTL
jgi:hypothetical protein